jgi:hypothetical protein
MKVKALTLLNIILATMLITSLFLMSTRKVSNNKLANGSAGEYDPWKDINDDGVIEMMDFYELGLAYGASGDPTKNVNVTNWPQPYAYNLQTGTVNMASNSLDNVIVITCGSYSRLSILMLPRNGSIGAAFSITIYLFRIEWDASPYPGYFGTHCYSSDFLDMTKFNFTMYRGGGWTTARSYMTETKAPYCCLTFEYQGGDLPENWWVTFDYAVYLRNE